MRTALHGRTAIAATVLFAFAWDCGNAFAQDNSRDDSSTGATIKQTTVEDLQGISINKDNFKDFISVGNAGSDITARQRVFVIYNIGTKKYLAPGGYWGRHASLSDKPYLFWMQRRNEALGEHEKPFRYPTCQDDSIKFDGDPARFNINFLKQDFSSTYFGSQEGKGRSYATYKSVNIVGKDDTFKRNLLENLIITDGSDVTTNETTSNFQPEGKQFHSNRNLSEFVPSDGDALVAEIILPTEFNDQQSPCLFSIGPKIAEWNSGAQQGNLHFYYMADTKKVRSAYVPSYNKEGYKWDTKQTFTPGATVTIKIDKEGVHVGDELVYGKLEPAYSGVSDTDYAAKKAGDIILFQCDENGNYKLTNDNELIESTDGTGKPYSAKHTSYVYVDDPTDDNVNVFFSQKIIKEDDSYDSVDKFLAFAYDPNLKDRSSVGIFTDRSITGYTSSNTSYDRAQWTLVPADTDDQKGVYRLRMTMKSTLTGETTSEPQTYYLTAKGDRVYGSLAPTTTNDQHYYYHQMDEDGNWNKVDDYSMDMTSADLNEEDGGDNGLWKIITVDECSKLQDNSQDALLEPVDLTYLISDPAFTKKSGGLAQWQISDGLKSTDNTYGQAKLRIGYEGVYKTSPSDKNYYGGLNYNFDEDNSINYSGSQGNTLNTTHSQYQCVSIQNGGYGKFYQMVPVYKAGWYIIGCQGMSTSGAKLYVKNCGESAVGSVDDAIDDDAILYPLATITQDDYKKLVAEDATKVYWPLDSKMPMYNAAVWMNDPHVQAGQANIEKYKTQVAIYVPQVYTHTGLTQDYSILEIGIYVPQSEGQTATRAAADVEFTAFSSFQLYYSGTEEETKALLLNEDFTDLNYLEGTTETYTNVDLHLNRTFNARQWNTLVLPVSLTKEQFTGAFGNDAELIKVSKIEGRKLIFVNEEEETDGIYLQANHPYLIWTSKANGDYPKVYGELTNKTTTEVTVPKNHFLIKGVTLPVNNSSNDGYSFSDNPDYTIVNGDTKWLYTVKDETSAQNSDGTQKATFYGTLCKTYEDKSILADRPALSDGKSYYMKAGDSSNFYYRKNGSAYGLKGFRCWFVLDDDTNQQTKYAIEINGSSDETTKIDGINTDEGSDTISRYSDAVYNTSGQKVANGKRLDSLPAGVYIANGKKFVITK